MKPKWICGLVLLPFLWAGSSSADSVYFWTDEDGVRHYSNTGVPSDVQEADVRPEEISPEASASPSEAGVDNALEPGIPEPEEGTPAEEAPEVEGGREADGRLAARIEKERQRLEAEIKKIEGLAIGRSFTPGMKAARIRPLQEQLALLDADPERYFRMKRQGAFSAASGAGTGESDSLSGSLERVAPAASTGASAGDGRAGEEEAPTVDQE